MDSALLRTLFCEGRCHEPDNRNKKQKKLTKDRDRERGRLQRGRRRWMSVREGEWEMEEAAAAGAGRWRAGPCARAPCRPPRAERAGAAPLTVLCAQPLRCCAGQDLPAEPPAHVASMLRASSMPQAHFEGGGADEYDGSSDEAPTDSSFSDDASDSSQGGGGDEADAAQEAGAAQYLRVTALSCARLARVPRPAPPRPPARPASRAHHTGRGPTTLDRARLRCPARQARRG